MPSKTPAGGAHPAGSQIDTTRDFAIEWIGRSTGRQERRQVAVLACGMHLPDHAAPIDPEEHADLLWRRVGIIKDIVERHAGRMVRADSDIQIACWGWPTAGESDTRMALAAAEAIAGELGQTVKCSLDAGIALTQSTDGSSRGLGLLGDVFRSVVAQLSSCGEGRVFASATVRGLIAEASVPPMIDGRAANDVGTDAPFWHPTADPEGILVGRAQESEILAGHWRQARTGQARSLHIHGLAGVGKSALVARLKQPVNATHGTVVEIVCRPETQSAKLPAVHNLLAALVHIRRGKVDTDIAGHDLVTSAPPPASLPARPLLDTLLALLREACAATPVVVAIDNMHWADQQTADLVADLRQVIESTRDALLPLMLITTGRWALQPRSFADREPCQLALQPLSSAQIEAMLASSPLAGRLATTTLRQIAEHSEGIPLAAWELAHLCAEAPNGDAPHRLLSRPNRLNAGLVSRLDALGPLKPLAQAASVIGRDIDHRVLAASLGMDPGALRQRLDLLVGAGVLFQTDIPRPCYRFVNALIWSAAYGTLPKSNRRVLHRKAASELTNTFPAIAAANPAMVANHFTKAMDAGNAFVWWRRAALLSAGQGSAAAAVSHVNQALAAKARLPGACTPIEEAELMSLLWAQIGLLRGSASTEAVAAYERALQLIDGVASRPADLSFDIGWGLAAIHLVRGQVNDALSATARLVEEAREHGRDDLMLIALRMDGTARMVSGRVGEAVDLLGHASRLYDRSRHAALRNRYVSDQGAITLAHLSSALALAGDKAASVKSQRQALELAAALGHAHTSTNVLGVLSVAATNRGERGAALALAHAGSAMAVGQDQVYWQARAALFIAWDQCFRLPHRDLTPMLHAIERYEATGAGRAIVLAHCLLADLAIVAGQPARAIEALDLIATRARQAGELIYLPEITRLKALALAALDPDGVTSTALPLLATAEAMARSFGALAFADRAAANRDALVRRHSKPA